MIANNCGPNARRLSLDSADSAFRILAVRIMLHSFEEKAELSETAAICLGFSSPSNLFILCGYYRDLCLLCVATEKKGCVGVRIVASAMS